MTRARISKSVLDGLIRAKLETSRLCSGVAPLPVVWTKPSGTECNWRIPGWRGDQDAVQLCQQHMHEYLRVLRTQFDIPDEP